MASALLVLGPKAQPIIARDYRGEVKLQDVPSRFGELIMNKKPHEVAPVISDDGVTYCWARHNELYAVTVSRLHINTATMLVFLQRLFQLFSQYFRGLDEEILRDNFVTVYEILDEVIDNGYPQMTEPRVLKKFLTSSKTSLTASSAVNAPVSWRADGIRHKKNEVFLDVLEKIDCLVTSANRILRAEIVGTLRMKSCLSGMPELKLGLNDKHSLDPADGRGYENIRFHQCVRLNKFGADGTISFVPPDGEFDLMSYTLSHLQAEDETCLPFWVEASLGPSYIEPSSTRLEYFIKVKSTFKPNTIATKLELSIPTHREASSPSFKYSSGLVKYHPETCSFVWSLKHMPGQKEQILTAIFSRPTTTSNEPDLWYKRPVDVEFEIPFFTLSQTTVKYLKIFESTGYQALPWVRYITQNGSYQFRMT